MGLAIAGAIERRVRAAEADTEPDTVLHQAAMDFARVSRAVRMTLALQSRLVQDFKAPARSAQAAAGAGGDTYLVRWLGEDAAQRAKVQRTVRRIAEDNGLDAETVERLAVEAGERLERDDIYDLLARPTGEIVAWICKDLGLATPSPLMGEGWDGGDLSAPPTANHRQPASLVEAEPPPPLPTSPPSRGRGDALSLSSEE